MPRAKRTDANHAEIRDKLRDYGYHVIDVHDRPGMLDLIVKTRLGYLAWLEVKIDEKEKLTTAEAKLFAVFPQHCRRVWDWEQAVMILEEFDCED